MGIIRFIFLPRYQSRYVVKFGKKSLTKTKNSGLNTSHVWMKWYQRVIPENQWKKVFLWRFLTYHIMLVITRTNLGRGGLCLITVGEYNSGRLNRDFLPRAYLTNEIVVVLLKFRAKRVAGLEKIEIILCCIKISDNKCSFWDFVGGLEVILNKKKIYEIKKYVFGSTSSWSNFELDCSS